jgi:hypothetical protein
MNLDCFVGKGHILKCQAIDHPKNINKNTAKTINYKEATNWKINLINIPRE